MTTVALYSTNGGKSTHQPRRHEQFSKTDGRISALLQVGLASGRPSFETAAKQLDFGRRLSAMGVTTASVLNTAGVPDVAPCGKRHCGTLTGTRESRQNGMRK